MKIKQLEGKNRDGDRRRDYKHWERNRQHGGLRKNICEQILFQNKDHLL